MPPPAPPAELRGAVRTPVPSLADSSVAPAPSAAVATPIVTVSSVSPPPAESNAAPSLVADASVTPEAAPPPDVSAPASVVPEPPQATSGGRAPDPGTLRPTNLESLIPPQPRRRNRRVAGLALAAALVLGIGVVAVRASAPADSAVAAAEVVGATEPQAVTPEAAGPGKGSDTAAAEATVAAATTPAPATTEGAESPAAPEPASPTDSSSSAPSAPVSGESETRAEASASQRTRKPTSTIVTVYTEPETALIYDERERIGKGVARIKVFPGQKRHVVALLNRHHPAHVNIDGSSETVHITMQPMDAETLARSISRTAAEKRTRPTKR